MELDEHRGLHRCLGCVQHDDGNDLSSRDAFVDPLCDFVDAEQSDIDTPQPMDIDTPSPIVPPLRPALGGLHLFMSNKLQLAWW